MTARRIVAFAGMLAWLMVGVPVLIGGATVPMTFVQWAIAYGLFGALFLADLRWPRLWLLALQGLCVVVVVLLLCDGFEGTLMVLIALQLGARVDRRTGALWIAAQTLLLGAAIAIHWTPRSAFLLTPPYLGFQVLGFVLMRTNAQLHALQGIVADNSRIAERLRIAQELHDALGHRLTVLTLNLEAALLRSSGEARQDVEKAQAIAREVLADVRAIVAGDQNDSVNLAQTLRALVADVPRPHVHLQADDDLRLRDPERANILLRCVQEIITNAARHSGAENLWIVIRGGGEELEISAHDDGRGSGGARDGFGLRGMRSRLERAGGELRIENRPGSGFGIVAVLPLRSGA